jgi:hypothetical protein
MVAIKEEKSPSLFGVYLVALVVAWFGGLLGFVYLTTFPLQAHASMSEYEAARAELDTPEIPKPDDGFYIEGAISSAQSWEAKRALLSKPGPQTVTLTEGEMNAWMESRLSVVEPTAGTQDSNLVVVPEIPRFAIVEGRGLYINLPLSVYIFETRYEYVLSALGSVNTGGFEPESVSLNRAALPIPSILGARVMRTLAEAFQSTEDYKILVEALDRAASVSIESDALVFELR